MYIHTYVHTLGNNKISLSVPCEPLAAVGGDSRIPKQLILIQLKKQYGHSIFILETDSVWFLKLLGSNLGILLKPLYKDFGQVTYEEREVYQYFCCLDTYWFLV